MSNTQKKKLTEPERLLLETQLELSNMLVDEMVDLVKSREREYGRELSKGETIGTVVYHMSTLIIMFAGMNAKRTNEQFEQSMKGMERVNDIIKRSQNNDHT